MPHDMRERSWASGPMLKDSRRLSFYASVFDAPTTVYDYGAPNTTERTAYTEIVRPGAFRESLQGMYEVIANEDHKPDRTFARKSDGSLLIQEDGKGLFCSTWLPENSLGNEILQGVKAGHITGGSFRFQPTVERWTDGPTCELLAVKLADVCITATPAYGATKGEVHVRTADRLQELFSRISLVKIKMRRHT